MTGTGAVAGRTATGAPVRATTESVSSLRRLLARLPRPPRPAVPPLTPREARARRAYEALVGLAVSIGAIGLATRPATWPAGPPLVSVPVDVAADGPSRLRLLPGIGPARLRALLADRTRHGPVATLEDLDRVPGLGPRTVEALRRAGAVVGRPPHGTVADADPRRAPPP